MHIGPVEGQKNTQLDKVEHATGSDSNGILSEGSREVTIRPRQSAEASKIGLTITGRYQRKNKDYGRFNDG